MKLSAITLLFWTLIITGCESEFTEETTSAPAKVENEVVENNVQQSKVFVIEGFCDCLDTRDSRECIEEQISKSKHSNPGALEDALLKNACFQEKIVSVEAEKLCDCLNRIEQVSLKCDELQKELDQKYSRKEQKAISECFHNMDCLQQ